MAEHHLYTNRLIRQKSPYLQQHAHNPVDWYPWGEEAFKVAKEKDKPIFLSIGYATCHWCHVMETESFENIETATLLNEIFVNIKIDREELPEVDNLYMEFAQSMMAGVAGWPLNIILTPELQPFFAATYLPPKQGHGLMGLEDLAKRIRDIWAGDEREKILEQAHHIVEAFAQHVHVRGTHIPEVEQVEDGAEQLFKMADPTFGGIRGMPKFPVAYQWQFLLNYSLIGKDSRALFLVERTLDMMQRGGIYDHLGGGFSRYSVDDRWLVPHFEKMLYDNALLASVYLAAWQMTKAAFYRSTCEEILSYVLRDMTHPEGGFFSAEDADSEGHEGYFYTWTYEEVLALLGEDAPLFCEYYGITREGNFEGRNILHVDIRLEEFANKIGQEPEELAHFFEKQRQILWKAREKRQHPFKDDKVLSSWNGLMIHAMAEAGVAFGYKSYSNAAIRAAQFIRKHMWCDGHLMRRWRDDEALYKAGLDEYAFLIRGLITLFEVGHGSQWLEWAMLMTKVLKDEFKAENGAFYQTDGKDENIILRKCQFSDGAEPSGNAIHCENLLRLYRFTLDKEYLEDAEDIFKAVKKFIDNYSPGYCYHLNNLIRYSRLDAATVVIALNAAEEHKGELEQLLYQKMLPFRSIIWRNHADERLLTLIPFVEKQVPVDGKTTLYICQHGACSKPITDLHGMIETINAL